MDIYCYFEWCLFLPIVIILMHFFVSSGQVILGFGSSVKKILSFALCLLFLSFAKLFLKCFELKCCGAGLLEFEVV